MEQPENRWSSIRTLQAVLLCTAMFSAMGGPALAPALPAIKATYSQIPHIEFWVKMLVAVSGLFATVGAPLFGWISDIYGRRQALILAIGLWAVAGASGMLPQPFWSLLAGRALLGFSLGGLLAANTAMIADRFERHQQRHMMGLQSSFSATGVILALIISGWLADLDWRLVFMIFLPGFALLPLAIRSTDATAPAGPTAKAPVFSLAMGLLCFFGFMASLAFNIIPTQLPFFMHAQGAESSARIGILMAVLPLSSAITGRVYAHLSHVFTMWNLFLFSGIFLLAGLWTVSYAADVPGMVAGLGLIGVGFGTAMPHSNISLAHVVPPEARGRAMGIMTACKFLGFSASPILLQPVLVQTGYSATFRIAGSIMLGVAGTVWLLGYFQARPASDSPRQRGAHHEL